MLTASIQPTADELATLNKLKAGNAYGRTQENPYGLAPTYKDPNQLYKETYGPPVQPSYNPQLPSDTPWWQNPYIIGGGIALIGILLFMKKREEEEEGVAHVG